MKTGLVLEGGAMRGLFTAGVIDVLMENNIKFNGAIGVSAGAAFGCNYKSGQIGRVIRYSKRFANNKKYASLWSLLTTGDYFGAEYAYHFIPNKLDIVDFETFRNNPMEFWAVATNVGSGKAVYRQLNTLDYEELEFVRASASMPLVSNIVKLNGQRLLDGGVADSIPLAFFQKQGYQRNVVVLTQPKGYRKQPNKLMPLMHLQLHRHPKMLKALAERHIMYNKEVDLVLQEERKGNVFVLQPQIKLTIGHTSHNPKKMQETYEHGRKVATEELEKLKQFLAK
ncbi:patatin-like phospholipase family protein [Prevotella pallens]|jgi:rssA protein|uniref:Patatin/cPLA2 family phospholipase n=2 Tax=Prevotella pallens TaxID=60133 RepID=A0ABX9DWS6_9BACT|nr:patatin family protein [Prevotella pallens]EGQ12627.1 alpha-beta hydrolase superfamily esterase [Prevotella pallens ATCC 700821]MBF1457653.1 patatin family protein [Prevotella pallens]MBF1476813.1 patatin family protein [Prevotella pallens]MBF1485932.1 patatin family protein [Prevotella pallens]MBF1489030.1 patatin family protein [Prevotella pallens]